jgi:serine/threonine-protein kinase
MALETGDRVGDYQVVGLIGAGGMGRVYKVRNIISNRDEAMKILLPDLTSERELAVRFMMEIRTLATLEHPNIAQLRTAFQYENQLVMIMEFVEGVTLEKLATESPLTVDAVLDYSTQVLSALSFAHTHGVIHRDIKPANVMITPHGVAKLMDFGIAKNSEEMHLTRPGMTIGSVYYMSPEQVRGGTIDARSDLYSFGILLYELLTGRKPFQADTSYSVLNAQLNEAPIPPMQVNGALSPEMNAIVLHALAKNPEERFQTAQEFHDALKALREPQMQAGAAPMAAAALGFAPVAASSSAGFSATSAVFQPVSTGGAVGGPVAGAMTGQAASAGASAPPAFAPVAVGAGAAGAGAAASGPANPFGVKPGAPKAKSSRGLWIGMGALAAVLALVAAAVILPHVFATFAKQKAASMLQDAASQAQTQTQASAAAPTAETASATAPAAELPAKAGTADEPVKQPAAHPQGTIAGQHRPAYGGSGGAVVAQAQAQQGGVGLAGNAAASPGPQVLAGPTPQEVREAHKRMMNLEARADAVREGIRSIRSQQQAQGLDLRGDILGSLNRMNNNLREAHASMGQSDLQAAGEYMDQADKEAQKLELFLGR